MVRTARAPVLFSAGSLPGPTSASKTGGLRLSSQPIVRVRTALVLFSPLFLYSLGGSESGLPRCGVGGT
jgi:hypothetical protein